MRRFFEKLFPKKIVVRNDVPLRQLESWLTEQLVAKEIYVYCQSYLQQVQQFQNELAEKAVTLKNSPVTAEDKKHVDVSVQNVVKGHRDHYVREIQRFAQELVPAVHLKQLSDYETLLQFNQQLQQKMDALGKTTHKSYLATQHLFFEDVEGIFQVLGELNQLAKSFRADKMTAIKNLTTAISLLHQEKEKRDLLDQQITAHNEKIGQIANQQQECQQQRNQLMQSAEYSQYLQLQQSQEQLQARKKEVEDAIHSFFAKLQKPLKRYERMASDTKLVQAYLGNSIEAFTQDYNLNILKVLSGLAKNLETGHLEVEEKQRKNYLELLRQHPLQVLHDKVIALRQEETALDAEFKKNKVRSDMQKIERELALLENKMAPANAEREDVLVKVGKLNVERKKEAVTKLIKEIVGVEIQLKE
ncbi:hypothetical protein HYU22_04635 [Candidatus Woesearchaeota archaeon]|nr:hypothetical protein [Candidatus Woesearchaeota archaeon]